MEEIGGDRVVKAWRRNLYEMMKKLREVMPWRHGGVICMRWWRNWERWCRGSVKGKSVWDGEEIEENAAVVFERKWERKWWSWRKNQKIKKENQKREPKRKNQKEKPKKRKPKKEENQLDVGEHHSCRYWFPRKLSFNDPRRRPSRYLHCTYNHIKRWYELAHPLWQYWLSLELPPDPHLHPTLRARLLSLLSRLRHLRERPLSRIFFL